MDDSDQDFVDLCSKLLKRVRKKPGEPKQPSKAEPQPSSQAGDREKRRRNNKRDGDSGSKCAGTQSVCSSAAAEQHEVCGETGPDSRDAGSSAERGLAAKDKVLHRMQQFKRVSPQRMGHKDQNHCVPPPPAVQRQDTAESCSSGLHPEPQDSDEALALRLQQELDREAADVQTVDLEDGGLFFCQICHRDLSHMTPEGRTQHLNRCLDDSEESAPAAPPPDVPDCPICGKKFKSRKSRSAHLKRCSSDMGVPPAVLLQALQRQTEETQNVPTASTLTETGGTKRKGSSKPGLPTRKKPRKNTEPVDEDTMVALALSSSLLEQERESERQLQTETAVSHYTLTPVLKWRPDAGKCRGKRKKGAVPRPPPLLLVQDAEVALTRLQERVSALLLRSQAPSPPTPTRCPSSLASCGGAAPLWQKSTLLDGGSTCLSDFYTPELREFITPWQPAMTEAASSINKPESSVQPASEVTPVARPGASTLPSSSSAPSTPGTGQLPVGSQAFRDLMELAEDGMTFTQYGYTASGPDEDKSAGPITNLHLSGFVPEESEERGDLCMSGFVPETTHKRSDDTDSQARRLTGQRGSNKERGSHQSAALSRLAADLSSMVNNPQLSDVQLQVDTGEVYFAHSFMVYARCPLLAEMVHESGFGVQEEGMPAAQRVLMSDIPGQAVFALLQYLYTAHCSIPASLQPHVLELASRFDLQELHQLCELHRDDAVTHGDEEDDMHQEENVNNQTDQAFMELLRSMWNEEDEGTDTDGRSDEERGLKEDRQADHLTAADREICEEKVNEEELEEIYEFAATQRKREEGKDSMEEEEEEEEEKVDEEEVFTKLIKPKRSSTCVSIKNLQLEPDPSLDQSYNRLFSDSWGVYEEGDPSSVPSTSGQPKTHTPQSQEQQPPHKPSSELLGRTLFQSSASVVDDLSLSPPPSASDLPVPGQSPGQVGDWGTDALDRDVPQEGLHLKRDSQGRHSICVPLSPDSPQKQKEPELIVLSDSGEEMEVILSSRSPSPHSPCAVQNLQRYTQINPRSVLKPNEPALENKKSSLEFCPDDPSSPVQSHPGSGCDQSLVDCSPEVSWLIPSTPLQHRRSITTSSTQTKSSMCRTQLFPKDDVSSSSVFSPPASPFNNRLQTSSSPARVPPHVGVFAVPPSQVKHSSPSNSTSLKQDTPLHLHPQPYSSTPLHTELLLPPVHLSSSPLHSNLDTVRSTSQGRDRAPSVSPDKTELGSFHLSPLSDPSGPPSSSHRGLQSSQRHSDSSLQSQQSVESSSHNHTGGQEVKRTGIRDEEGEREMKCENKDTDDEGQQEEAKAKTEVAEVESTFQQSFMAMDEPPIAFNDSWGFNVCVDENPGCFSLKLEDSRGSSQQERSLGQRETAGSSSSSDCQPPKSSLGVRLLNSHGSVTASSPSKAHGRQPSTSVQAHTGQSFTPSPPHPTTGTTPEINDSLLDSKIWDSWEEDEEEALPLSQRVNPSAQLKTPTSPRNKRSRTLVPITPMPHYSDMDTPDLKNKLNRFGVRPLPKRQMILKLKEIHQYTHQLTYSDSEDEGPSVGHVAQRKPQPTSLLAAGNKLVSCTQTVKFKEPRVPAATSPLKHNREEDAELLSASQGSNTSSTAASEESERSNPELCQSSDVDSDSDGGFSASQTATRLQDRLRAVRSFILSDSRLYTQILQYQPLVLSQLQQRLKAAGIRLGAAKLVDYLDSQCITFTTAKPGHSAPSRRRGKRTGRGAKAAGENGASRKRGVPAMQ
ncbi:structure-specific endonuclease subunit SLX4 isoform X2 [Dicentrarchus labrax]|uniref:structure-specific endonuclease subunit SLX4 isoform X2 n=1 Tax=Dicentrarchus labrax TaxID=13489 RepID=UPI0021F524EF|nr:structure-specific endonuclease subunit SLX4 isoform X2 [Dicentrarchus labrax]